MTSDQALVFGGVVVLLILRQPLYAIVWLCAVFFGVLDSAYYLQGLVLILFVSLFQLINTEARK